MIYFIRGYGLPWCDEEAFSVRPQSSTNVSLRKNKEEQHLVFCINDQNVTQYVMTKDVILIALLFEISNGRWHVNKRKAYLRFTNLRLRKGDLYPFYQPSFHLPSINFIDLIFCESLKLKSLNR